MIENIIIIAVLVIILGVAIGYVIHAKKSGKKCVGCPDSGCCSSSKTEGGECCCGCGEKK